MIFIISYLMANYANETYMLKQAQKTKKKWEKILKNNTPYLCKKCWKEKTPDAFVIQYINNQLVGKYRYLYECKQCKKERTIARRQKKKTTIAWACDRILKQLKQEAKKNDLEVTITTKDLLHLREKQSGKCYYTDMAMTFDSTWDMTWGSNKQDNWLVYGNRKTQTWWYTLENIVLCWAIIHEMKWDLHEKEFREICNVVHTA